MYRRLAVFLFILLQALPVHSLEVNITRDLAQFQVRHGEQMVTVMRKQDRGAMIAPDFMLTSRPCPPFCAQPMQVAPGVRTIGEVELTDFMRNELAQGRGILVDARTPDWHQRGTIPGSVNIPYTRLNPGQGADDITLAEALAHFNVTERDGGWDFSRARSAVLWCNGPWCGQSPTAIRGLLGIGYPAEKLLYYRGGLQVWRVFGLTVVSPEGEPLEE